METKEPESPAVQKVAINRIALESCAAARALKDLAEKGEHENGALFLESLWMPVMDAFHDSFDLQALAKKDVQKAAHLSIAMSVLGGYFLHHGDWKKIIADLESVFLESQNLPKPIADAVIGQVSEQFLKAIREGVIAMKKTIAQTQASGAVALPGNGSVN